MRILLESLDRASRATTSGRAPAVGGRKRSRDRSPGSALPIGGFPGPVTPAGGCFPRSAMPSDGCFPRSAIPDGCFPGSAIPADACFP